MAAQKVRTERWQCAVGSPESIELLSVGIASEAEAGEITRHFDDICTCEYVLSGAGTVTIHDDVHRMSTRDAYILPRDATHTLTPEKDRPWTKLWFCVRGKLVEALIDLYGLRDRCRFAGFDRPDMFHAMRDIAVKRPADAAERAALAFHSFCMHASSVTAQGRYSADIARAVRYLDTHAAGVFRIDELSAVMPHSPSQITRRFRAQTGTTPYQYFMQRKIDRAKILLVTTAISLQEIARELSFTDQFHFSNTFKKHAGSSPEAYRRRV